MAFVQNRSIFEHTPLEAGKLYSQQEGSYEVLSMEAGEAGIEPGMLVKLGSGQKQVILPTAKTDKIIGIVGNVGYGRSVDYSLEDGFEQGSYIKNAILPVFIRGQVTAKKKAGVTLTAGAAVRVNYEDDTKGVLDAANTADSKAIQGVDGIKNTAVDGDIVVLALSGEQYTAS